MSVEKFTKLETYKGVKKRKAGLEQFFVDLKFNKKKPKYNYHSGLVAGMLVDNLTILRPILEHGGKVDEDLGKKILEKLVPMAESLVTTFNWNMFDLNMLAEQFFGDQE